MTGHVAAKLQAMIRYREDREREVAQIDAGRLRAQLRSIRAAWNTWQKCRRTSPAGPGEPSHNGAAPDSIIAALDVAVCPEWTSRRKAE